MQFAVNERVYCKVRAGDTSAFSATVKKIDPDGKGREEYEVHFDYDEQGKHTRIVEWFDVPYCLFSAHVVEAGGFEEDYDGDCLGYNVGVDYVGDKNRKEVVAESLKTSKRTAIYNRSEHMLCRTRKRDPKDWEARVTHVEINGDGYNRYRVHYLNDKKKKKNDHWIEAHEVPLLMKKKPRKKPRKETPKSRRSKSKAKRNTTAKVSNRNDQTDGEEEGNEEEGSGAGDGYADFTTEEDDLPSALLNESSSSSTLPSLLSVTQSIVTLGETSAASPSISGLSPITVDQPAMFASLSSSLAALTEQKGDGSHASTGLLCLPTSLPNSSGTEAELANEKTDRRSHPIPIQSTSSSSSSSSPKNYSIGAILQASDIHVEELPSFSPYSTSLPTIVNHWDTEIAGCTQAEGSDFSGTSGSGLTASSSNHSDPLDNAHFPMQKQIKKEIRRMEHMSNARTTKTDEQGRKSGDKRKLNEGKPAAASKRIKSELQSDERERRGNEEREGEETVEEPTTREQPPDALAVLLPRVQAAKTMLDDKERAIKAELEWKEMKKQLDEEKARADTLEAAKESMEKRTISLELQVKRLNLEKNGIMETYARKCDEAERLQRANEQLRERNSALMAQADQDRKDKSNLAAQLAELRRILTERADKEKAELMARMAEVEAHNSDVQGRFGNIA